MYHPKPKVEKHADLTVPVPVKDRDNPLSIISLAPMSIERAIMMIPDDVFEMSTNELLRKFRTEKYDQYTEVEEKLRISFWKEYERAVDTGRRIDIRALCAGICQERFFLRHMCGNSFRLAYLLTPPNDYVVTIEELLRLGLEQIRDILLQPHVDDKGRPDARMCEVKAKIVERVENRVKGMVAHRVETKNLNLNIEAEQNVKRISGADKLNTLEDIERRLNELRAGDTGEALDVTPKT